MSRWHNLDLGRRFLSEIKTCGRQGFGAFQVLAFCCTYRNLIFDVDENCLSELIQVVRLTEKHLPLDYIVRFKCTKDLFGFIFSSQQQPLRPLSLFHAAILRMVGKIKTLARSKIQRGQLGSSLSIGHGLSVGYCLIPIHRMTISTYKAVYECCRNAKNGIIQSWRLVSDRMQASRSFELKSSDSWKSWRKMDELVFWLWWKMFLGRLVGLVFWRL